MIKMQADPAGGLVAAAALATAPAHAGKTLDQSRRGVGRLWCQHRPGWFFPADSQGNWTGLDVDICRPCRCCPGRRQQGERVR